ncbi:MAG TPA: hypothetical protein VL993_09150 [Stellaceae bacterium]|nr:hypothetical protein [Stellaceae bacterium]
MARVDRASRAATARIFSSGRSRMRASDVAKALALAIIVLIALDHVLDTTPSRGPAIRDALMAAAAKVKSLPTTATPAEISDALAPDFRSFAVEVNASRYPVEVDVTLGKLDGVTCLQAEDVARRIEGSVVVELEGFGTAAACGVSNAMTWRLLP